MANTTASCLFKQIKLHSFYNKTTCFILKYKYYLDPTIMKLQPKPNEYETRPLRFELYLSNDAELEILTFVLYSQSTPACVSPEPLLICCFRAEVQSIFVQT